MEGGKRPQIVWYFRRFLPFAPRVLFPPYLYTICCLPSAQTNVLPRRMKSEPHSIEIIGGGLAGLATGIYLRQRGVPVALHEAGNYPRHRVCGEFLCGSDDTTFRALGIADLLPNTAISQHSSWYNRQGHQIFHTTLPNPVRGISRNRMDDALAAEFVRLGGHLHTQSRQDTSPKPGRVLTHGRVLTKSTRWSGLKAHFHAFPLFADLEIHLGQGGYIGLAQVEDKRVNVCGLFPTSALKSAGQAATPMIHAARAIGLTHLAKRLAEASPIEGSLVGCTRFALGWQDTDDALRLGDAMAIIPPFTGNGMTMALSAAQRASQPLADYSAGAVPWPDTVHRIQQDLRREFAQRMRWATWAHPALLHPLGQFGIRWLARAHLFPFQRLFRLTH